MAIAGQSSMEVTVVGTGQASPTSFNSQQRAYRSSKMAMNPVRLRLTVKLDPSSKGINDYSFFSSESLSVSTISWAFERRMTAFLKSSNSKTSSGTSSSIHQ